jgi:hypothetical protein
MVRGTVAGGTWAIRDSVAEATSEVGTTLKNGREKKRDANCWQPWRLGHASVAGPNLPLVGTP